MTKIVLIDLPMPIMTERLLIRPPQMGDGKILNAAILESIEQLRPFIPWAKECPSLDNSEEFVRQSAADWITKSAYALPLLIFNQDTQVLIGAADFHNIKWDVPRLELSYWARTSAVGKGYMTEALSALVDYAFKELQVKRITVFCNVENHRSKGLAERLGFQLEGVLKSSSINYVTGEVTDSLLFGRTRHNL